MACDMHVTPLSYILSLSSCSAALTIDGLEFNRTSLTLTCTTSGRPVHTITWLKDGTVVGTEFSQAQTITSTLTATYQHTLSSDDIANLVGSFTCMVMDAEGNSPPSRTLRFNGIAVQPRQSVVNTCVPLCRCGPGKNSLPCGWCGDGDVLQ